MKTYKQLYTLLLIIPPLIFFKAMKCSFCLCVFAVNEPNNSSAEIRLYRYYIMDNKPDVVMCTNCLELKYGATKSTRAQLEANFTKHFILAKTE